MLKDLQKIASEMFPEDIDAQQEFMTGFYKEASIGGFFTSPMPTGGAENMRSVVLKGLGQAVGKGVGDIAMALGATSVASAYGAVRDSNLHNKFLQALEKAYAHGSILRGAKKEKVLQYGETIFKFAPHVSTDVNMLTSILSNAIQGEGIDVMTIKTITELENRYKDNNSFSPKTYV